MVVPEAFERSTSKRPSATCPQNANVLSSSRYGPGPPSAPLPGHGVETCTPFGSLNDSVAHEPDGTGFGRSSHRPTRITTSLPTRCESLDSERKAPRSTS
jgi:hypothetical protein